MKLKIVICTGAIWATCTAMAVSAQAQQEPNAARSVATPLYKSLDVDVNTQTVGDYLKLLKPRLDADYSFTYGIGVAVTQKEYLSDATYQGNYVVKSAVSRFKNFWANSSEIDSKITDDTSVLDATITVQGKGTATFKLMVVHFSCREVCTASRYLKGTILLNLPPHNSTVVLRGTDTWKYIPNTAIWVLTKTVVSLGDEDNLK